MKEQNDSRNLKIQYARISPEIQFSDSRGSQKEGLNWLSTGKNNKNIRCKSEKFNFLKEPTKSFQHYGRPLSLI